MIDVDTPIDAAADAGLEAAMRALSSISATLSESYAALEARTQRIERELERKLAELDALRRHLSAVLDALPTGVVVRDAAGRVLRVNDAALTILGTDAEQLLGSLDHPLLDDSAAREAADGWRERELEGPDGERRVLASRHSPVPGQGSVEILDDRTALVELTERLHGLDKLAALGNMAGGIAHELRNPMHAAAGFAALLIPRLAQDSKERHFAQCIARSLAGAEGVLTSMLTLASPDGLVPEDDRQAPRGEVTGRDLEIRTADGAGGDPQQELAGARTRIRHVAEAQGAGVRGAWLLKDERAHRCRCYMEPEMVP